MTKFSKYKTSVYIFFCFRSAFVLLDNERLEELWDWEARDKDIKILNGRLAIHFNPKLCFYKIEKFAEIANISGFTEDEVPRGTNGDKEACTLKKIINENSKSKLTFVVVIFFFKFFK